MIIELLNGTRYDVESYGLKRLFHHIPSAEIVHTTNSVDGGEEIIIDTHLVNRTISVEFLYRVDNIQDFYFLRDELNALFARKEAFYITFKKEPRKRWKVRIGNGFKIEPHPRMGSLILEFRTVQKYAESVGDYVIQSYATNNFSLYNEGNTLIDPRENELEITIVGTVSNLLTITNRTTGDVYTISGPFTTANTIKLSGIRTTINNVSNYGRTNGGLITLAPGNNQFTITGGAITSIVFKYRNLYK